MDKHKFVFNANLLAMIEEYFRDADINTLYLQNTMQSLRDLKSEMESLEYSKALSVQALVEELDSTVTEHLFADLIEKSLEEIKNTLVSI